MRKTAATLLFTAFSFATIFLLGCPATPGKACASDLDLDCDDRDPCTINLCAAGGVCTADVVEDANCADRDLPDCRTDDDCDRGDPCTTSLFIPGGTCVHAPLCIDSICTDGVCVDCLADAGCDDGLACTDDSCVAGECVNAEIDCDDGLFCNGLETCDESSGTCMAGDPPCFPHLKECVEEFAQCVIVDPCSFDSDCADELFCTGVETCIEGLCVSSGNPCDAPDPCDTLFCDESSQTCLSCPPGFACDPLYGFTLGADTITGTGCHDRIDAPLLFNAPTGTSKPSFQTGDSFDGLEGVDTVSVQFNFDVETTVQATLINVEQIIVTDFGTAATTMDATDFSGVERLSVANNTLPNKSSCALGSC